MSLKLKDQPIDFSLLRIFFLLLFKAFIKLRDDGLFFDDRQSALKRVLLLARRALVKFFGQLWRSEYQIIQFFLAVLF